MLGDISDSATEPPWPSSAPLRRGAWLSAPIQVNEAMPRANARTRGASPQTKVRRASYDMAFKTHVVRTALQRPPNNRIKPTCALFPGIEPCQVRRSAAWASQPAGHPVPIPPKRPTSRIPDLLHLAADIASLTCAA